MSNNPIVLLKTKSQPDVIDSNGRIYTKESFHCALEKYLQAHGDLKIPVTINPPYLDGRKFTALEYLTVNLKDKIGYIDLMSYYEDETKEKDFNNMQVIITNMDMLRYIDGRYEFGLRYMGVIREYSIACAYECVNMNLICYDLLPKEG